MRSPCCLCVCVSVAPPQQAGIVEPEETAVARQRLGKHVPAAMNTRNNRRRVGCGIFHAVRVVSNTQYVLIFSISYFAYMFILVLRR
jgi:hypothetical protein